MNVLFSGNKMGTSESKFEFRKTARHEFTCMRNEAFFDPHGRYVCICDVKGPGPFDKEKRSFRIFNAVGEQLHAVEKLPQLTGFSFRPRPQDILNKKQQAALKKDYRTKYGKKVKEETNRDVTAQQDETRERKAKQINEFL